LYWNRVDVEKDLEDKEAYNRINISIDADVEGTNDANEITEDIQYTTWINADSGTGKDIIDYVDALLEKRRIRHRLAQEIVSGTMELKDSHIAVGQLVLLDTKRLTDIYGNDIKNAVYRVISKSTSANRLKVKLRRTYSAEAYLMSEDGKWITTESEKNIISNYF
jgi:hypothetical protein